MINTYASLICRVLGAWLLKKEWRVVRDRVSYRIGLEGGVIFSRENMNAECNVCPTFENREDARRKRYSRGILDPLPWDPRLLYEGSTVRR